MPIFARLFGNQSASYLRREESALAAINALESELTAESDEQLKARTAALRSRLKSGTIIDDLVPEAFALVREAARRTLGERHYDVQILGGLALHRGKIAEMKTGEGKTLVTTLPAYLNALTGSGVHVVTVNDYLSRRDATWMGQVYALLGLSVGVLNHEVSYLYDPEHQELDAARDAAGSFRVFHQFLRPCTRREAYAADITYGTNNEFGFDYLRDHLADSPERVAQTARAGQTAHHYAIIDEVDSVLIDEARTPLIISAPVRESESLYQTFAAVAKRLVLDTDYTVEEKHKTALLTEPGITKPEQILGLKDIYSEQGIRFVHHLETAVRAKALFLRDRDYVVRNGEVIIVDEFTGRLQPGRRWSDGLHQAMEAKEGLAPRQESRTYASVTLQNYFKLYQKLAGMTGTASTSAEEFHSVYGLDVITLPTNQPNARQDLTDLVFRTETGKFSALVRRIGEIHQTGQPILVGTVSIEKNELLSERLKRVGIPHRILNAKNNEEEGAIIAEAGKRGSVVVATNMAGRGVDIKLGGALASEAEREEVRRLGGLFVIGTERHEARRIDNQLRGRSGRQGDLGSTQFYISFDDTLARVFASDKVKSMLVRLGLPEDEPIENRFVSRAIESAQTKIEGLNFDNRKHLLDYDTVLNHQRLTIYDRRDAILFDLSGRTARDFLERIMAESRASSEEKAAWPTLIAERITTLGEETFLGSLRRATLQLIDGLWVEHLESMEYLRGSVRLKAYGQRDPLVEYRREGLRLFKEMEATIADHLIKLLPTLGAESVAATSVKVVIPTSIQNPVTSGGGDKIGRNDPCPCGSGKKYKKCHGK